MSKLVVNFEKELKRGLSMKTRSGGSEEKEILNSFKYNDLNNKGRASYSDFIKILSKFGVHTYSNTDLNTIFAHYDVDGSGVMIYKEFISNLFGHPISDSKSTTVASSHHGSQFLPSQSQAVDHAEMDKIIDLLLYKLAKRGMSGVLEFWLNCKNCDQTNEELIDMKSFCRVANELRLELNQNEVSKIFRTYETRNNFELMNYQLLIKDLCINLNQIRKDMVRTMFERFDSNESGKVNLLTIGELFNPKNHFEVKSGRKTPDEVDGDFQQAIRLFRDVRGTEMVRSDHLIQMFQCISSAIESDFNFEAFMGNCFRYNEIPRASNTRNSQLGQSVMSTPIYDKEREHPSQSMKYTLFPGSDKNMSENYIYSIFEHIRKQLMKKGPKGLFYFMKSLKCNDHDHDGRLSCKEFIKALHEIRIELLEKETVAIYTTFDPRHTGFIYIDDFMDQFVPPTLPERKELVDELNAKVVSGGSVSFNMVHHMYNPRGHPDFRSGIKPDHVIKEEFFELLNIYLHLTSGVNDIIPEANWYRFIEMFSYSYEDTNFFDPMLRGVFKLSKYYGGLSESNYTDRSESRYGAPPADVVSTQSRPQTADSRANKDPSNLNYPFATDDRFNCGQADMQRPKSSVGYSENSRRGPIEIQQPDVNINKAGRGYDLINGQANAPSGRQSQDRYVEDRVPEPMEVPENRNFGRRDEPAQVKPQDWVAPIDICKSPQSEVSQATKDIEEKYSRRSNYEGNVQQGHTVSPDPSPPQDFKKKEPVVVQELPTRSLGQLKDYIKDRLGEIDPRGFLALERSFVLADDGKTRELNLDQFACALNENGLDTTLAEKRILFEASQGDARGLPYLKWISDMRGQMPPVREQLCSELFQLLDARGSKMINVDVLEKRFNPEAHNDFISKKKTADELWDDFADKLDLFGRLGGYDFKIGNITYDEFMEFWDNTSTLIRSDKDFEDLIRNCYIN